MCEKFSSPKNCHNLNQYMLLSRTKYCIWTWLGFWMYIFMCSCTKIYCMWRENDSTMHCKWVPDTRWQMILYRGSHRSADQLIFQQDKCSKAKEERVLLLIESVTNHKYLKYTLHSGQHVQIFHRILTWIFTKANIILLQWPAGISSYGQFVYQTFSGGQQAF
jgi:hypothetical protein